MFKAKFLIPVILALVAIPVTLWAQNENPGQGNILVPDPCFVPVYHLDFNFPEEGGVVIETNGKYYFVKTYLSQCQNAASSYKVVRKAGEPVPNVRVNTNTRGGQFLEFIQGNGCLVPVFHTDFVFPPEGGAIVKFGDKTYFVRTYFRGCENAGAGGVVIKSPTPTLPASTSAFVSGTNTTSTVNTETSCFVPVFHTDFLFPEQGGVIVKDRTGGMYFVKIYLSGCENAHADLEIIRK